MKIAILVDFLISRDQYTIITELILNLYPHAEIYTIAHKQGGILGEIERRPIVSSYLTHKIKTEQDLQKYLWILPSGIGSLPIHPSIEKAIIISRGYIHGVNLPANVKKYLYIVDWDSSPSQLKGWRRFFEKYINDWRLKKLKGQYEVAVSSEHLKQSLHLPNAEIIQATYRTEEYPFARDDQGLTFTHHLVYTDELKVFELKLLLDFLISKQEKVILLGKEDHIMSLKASYSAVEFGGDHCEATQALYSHQAKTIWAFSDLLFPAKALGALSTGRKPVVWDSPVNREYLGEDAYYLETLNQAILEKVYDQVLAEFEHLDRKSLRRKGLRWNERLFKSRMVKFLDVRD